MSVRFWAAERLGPALALGVRRDADDKHRESTDKQDEILAELRRVHERLDRLEARP